MVNHAGCTAYWDQRSFPILVSPDTTFTEEDLVWVYMATQRWNIEVGRKVFQVIPGVLQQGFHNTDGVEMTQAPLNADFLGFCPVVYHPSAEGTLGRVWRGACIIDKADISNRLIYMYVIIHELGHALGFTHDEDTGSVMFYRVSGADAEFQKKHLDTVRKMMDGTYKRKSIIGLPRCL